MLNLPVCFMFQSESFISTFRHSFQSTLGRLLYESRGITEDLFSKVKIIFYNYDTNNVCPFRQCQR
jgi:hypothetical protein